MYRVDAILRRHPKLALIGWFPVFYILGVLYWLVATLLGGVLSVLNVSLGKSAWNIGLSISLYVRRACMWPLVLRDYYATANNTLQPREHQISTILRRGHPAHTEIDMDNESSCHIIATRTLGWVYLILDDTHNYRLYFFDPTLNEVGDYTEVQPAHYDAFSSDEFVTFKSHLSRLL